jgi:hypothetical protein
MYIQDNRVKAYVTGHGDVIIEPDNSADVMTMSLPIGKFINTITLSVGPWPVTGPIPDAPVSFLSCQFVDDENIPVTGHLVGGDVIYHQSFAITLELLFWDQEINDVTLRCHSMETNESDSDIIIFSAQWTAVKVDDVVIQPFEP